ncbi:hypothetical protein H072_1719 [Dactylellina haptotyla CBS 200.50]|uniref:HTH CENPB-type domain-containing protein n=1 Tax=Dactylellina haptotyla (strain CBS 200.50) TaxID=1284197 RepID=S8AN45_DACHA|nr:hypothetical protein H072_1719 [Dactylellina haptotyla CBS 200.50]
MEERNDQQAASGEGEYTAMGGQWVGLGQADCSQTTAPANEFGMYGFVDTTQQMPHEPSYRLPSGGPASHSFYSTFPQWPVASAAPPMEPITTVTVPSATTTAPNRRTSSSSNHGTGSSRRTLTDADRRRMCLYHEQHPHVKQTEIGAMFGVERSTVSKVLRQREKYLYPDDGPKQTIKRPKGKCPDFDRALSNWAKNEKKKGRLLTDEMIREKASFFAQSCGVPDNQFKLNLDKFKLKNDLSTYGDGDIVQDMDRIRSQLTTPLHSRHSSFSREGSLNSSQDSHTRDVEYRHGSMTSGFETPVVISPGLTTPISPFFPSGDQMLFSSGQLPPIQQQSRPRSHTTPSGLLENVYISPPPSASESLSPKQMHHPMHMIPTNLANTTIPEETADALHEQAGGPVPTTGHLQNTTAAAVAHFQIARSRSMTVPSQEEATRALEVVMTFLKQNPTAEPNDFVTVEKLMDRIGNNTTDTPMQTDSFNSTSSSMLREPTAAASCN